MSWFDTPCTVGKLPLKGRFLMESGPFGHSGVSMAACTEAGFSAVSTETITLTDGTSPWWNLYQEGESLYNCSKWSDIPLAQWVEQEIPYAKAHGATVIATVGHTAMETEQIVPVLSKSGVDAIKLCTYHAEEIMGMVRAAKRLTDLPVWAKISANWPDFLEQARACQQAGADALVAIDTLGPIRVLEEGTRPALGSENGVGWMSGACIHRKALYVIEELKGQLNLPIVGVGGIMDATGVRRARAVGADLIGLCSTILIHGLGRLAEIQKELKRQPELEAMGTHVYRGAAHIEVDHTTCNHCGRCIEVCGYMALRMEGGKLHTADEDCRRCGLCQQTCPAIQIKEQQQR